MTPLAKVEKDINNRFEAGIGPDSIVYAKLLKKFIDLKFQDLYERLEKTFIENQISTKFLPPDEENS